MFSRTQLETAAVEVIQILKRIPDYSNARLAVIGGLALWKYIPTGRTTEDVDFIVNIGNAPHGVKQTLLALPNSPFVQRAQMFYYRSSNGAYVQIDVTPEWQSPYMPSNAVMLRDLPDGAIPYISVTDLVVFKVNSCGLRAQSTKKHTDAADAETLLEVFAARGPLVLTTTQHRIVEPCIADVVTYGTKSETWWRERLGLIVSK